MNFDLHHYLARRKEEVEGALAASLERRREPVAPRLLEAMAYSLTAGGKRLRPILCLAANEACGGAAEAPLPFALALEYIHTYSLIHDDLPAMDDDDLRRGRPTNHKVFGEGAAILAGDALLTEAFRLIVAHPAPLSPETRLQGLGLLADAAGENGMVGGQLLDLDQEGKSFTIDQLLLIHNNKTGRLLCAAVELGALAAGAPPAARRELLRYGQAIGLAFQLKDDLLDLEASEQIGKDRGSDLKNGKATILALLGRNQAEKRLNQEVQTALAALAGWPESAEPLRALARYISERGN